MVKLTFDRILLLLFGTLLAAGCRDASEATPSGWEPISSVAYGRASVADLDIEWRLVSQEPLADGRSRSTYDVEIVNSGQVMREGCVELSTLWRPLLSGVHTVGDGLLAPGLRVHHPEALVFEHATQRGVHNFDLTWKQAEPQSCPRTPNLVVFIADDLGYGDVDWSGDFAGLMPRVDELRRGGLELSAFYTSPTCSLSRAELMTGSYAKRVGVDAAYDAWSLQGLHPDEITLAEVAALRGYRSALVGKWHLGAWQAALPLAQGFDEFFGIPYSNDTTQEANPFNPKLRLYDDGVVIELEPDQSQFTKRFTERAVDFIERSADDPFLLIVAHPMPHVPLSVSKDFSGQSGAGLYGDVLMELDWSLGEIVDALVENGVENRTLVLFTSDNGPWLRFGNHAGSSGDLREGKVTSFEGGVRVPGIISWPGRVLPGRSDPAITGLIDVLPTLHDLLGIELPPDRIIDGQSLTPLFDTSIDYDAGRDSHVFFVNGFLQALRIGRWKLHIPHPYQTVLVPGQDGSSGQITQESIDLALFDMVADPAETENLAADHPEIVDSILNRVEAIRLDLGDQLLGIEGTGVRPEGDLLNL